jgi:polyhydroxyalkanoate synthase
MRLLQFQREHPPVWAEPLLICSAPVSRPYFLDLGARRSVVRQMLAAGFDIYLIDWGIATAADRGMRLSDLADRMLKNVFQFIRKRTRMPHFHLMGYCLGGTLATIFTARYPSVVKDLVLMSAPIDLGGENTLLKAWAGRDCFDVDAFIDAFGNCPGGFLRSFFALLDPVRYLYGKFGDLAGRMDDEETVESFVALQQWANAQVPVAGGLFRDVVESLYRDNLLAQGQLTIGGDPVRLDRISCAVLLLTATADRLVTPQSTLGLMPRICSRDVKCMSLEGGHEILAAGSKAHDTFWPEAAEWIADHSTPRTGPWIRPGESASGRPEFVFAEKFDPASKSFQQPTA